MAKHIVLASLVALLGAFNGPESAAEPTCGGVSMPVGMREGAFDKSAAKATGAFELDGALF